MSGFQVGERVTVVGNKWWEGEAVVTKVPKPGAPLYFIVKMETGRMKGREGGFVAEELRPRYDDGPFKPGDRVRYIGKSPIYVNKTRVGKVGEFIRDTSNGCGTILLEGDRDQCSVYLANLELEPQPVVTKDGDRVRVTIEGVVDGDPSNDTIRVSPDGARANYNNVIDISASGVTVDVIEPEFTDGTVVKDAEGVFYRKAFGGWWSFASDKRHAPHIPARPLTVVS